MPWVLLVLCLLGVELLHAAGNVLSDWFDYRSGVDNENAFAVPNLVFHHFEPVEYLTFSIVLFIAGATVGAIIAILSGPVLWIIGGVGVLLTALYSFFKFHALGDADIFIIFGVLTVLGTAYAVTGELHWDALMLSVPIGIITVSVLHANNTVDTESDRAAGIKTFAMLIGGKASSVLYAVYMVIPFVCIIAVVAAGFASHGAPVPCGGHPCLEESEAGLYVRQGRYPGHERPGPGLRKASAGLLRPAVRWFVYFGIAIV